MKHTFFLILLVSFCESCQDSTANLKRSVECYVRYLAPEGQLLAELSLRREYTDQKGLQAIESPGGVRYGGTLMRIIPAQGITYRLDQPGGYTNAHKFEWYDEKEQIQAFTMELPAITAFSFGTNTLSHQKPATLTWDGAPLDKGETMVMMWESVEGHLTVPMEVRATPGQNQINFPAAQIAKLRPGDWTLYLVRKKRVKSDVNGATLHGLMEYYTQVDSFAVN